MGVFSVVVALSGSLRIGALVLSGGFVLTIVLLNAVRRALQSEHHHIVATAPPHVQ
jgi:tRNA G37 N-methylase TrmD